jgi:GT2 family glycosyltransferase
MMAEKKMEIQAVSTQLIEGEQAVQSPSAQVIKYDQGKQVLSTQAIKNEQAVKALSTQLQDNKESKHYDTCVILHLYYPDMWSEIQSYLSNLEKQFDLIITIPYEVNISEHAIKASFPDVQIYRCENRGRDILPFLTVLSTILKLDYKYICKIHTKQNTSSKNGINWRQDMLDKLLGSPDIVSRIKKAMDDHPDWGLVAPKGYVVPDNMYWRQNANKVINLARFFSLPTDEIEFSYVAGTMFWFRPQVFCLLTKMDVLAQDFEPEQGQQDGTLTHAYERFFGMLTNYTGYIIAESDLQDVRLSDISFQFRLLAQSVENHMQNVQALLAQVADVTNQLERTSQELNEILISKTWKFALLLRKIRIKLFPPGSWRERPVRLIYRTLRSWRNEGLHLFQVKSRRISFAKPSKRNLGVTSADLSRINEIPEVELPVPPKPCRCSIDIIVCVHNALDDVKRCLSSVIQNTDQPYNLIIINDGSNGETTAFLDIFVNQYNNIDLVNNEIANGYTKAANQGLHISTSDLVILLNSDTVVSKDWANRMAAAMFSREKTGLVGPLSNTASWQSIPDIAEGGDWSPNPLPEGMSIQKMADSIAKYSGQIYPNVPLLNGFCWMFNREVINDIGYLDEENFGEGYGEEDDYILRARKAGWKIAWADDVYVYHAQSRSFSHERRKKLTQRALKTLFKKYDQAMIAQDCDVMLQDRVLNGIRERSKVLFEREEFIRRGLEKFRGKRVLFVLPISGPGGGGNVVIADGMAMLEMGVDVRLFNLISNRDSFLRSYPHLKLPVIFGKRGDIVSLASQYDAVIATMHTTVEWLEPIQQKDGYPVRGYYIQGFEALMYKESTDGYKNAIESYSLFSDLVRFTKTQWVFDQVLENTGMKCHIVGISNDIDLFRPRYPVLPNSNRNLIRIGGMVRAGSHYRSPVLTMNVFRRIAHEYGKCVQVIIFGVDPHNLDSMNVPKNFNFWSAGVINQKQMANLLNNLDIFVDFSSHQAMGLTALEAMACGCAVIVPANGGAVEFVAHEENGLVVDTSSEENCYQELKRLIDQDDLRKKIRHEAIVDVCRFHSQGTAYHILDALFQK